MGHSEWVHWTLAGDVASFYEHLRWPGWEEESAALEARPGLQGRPAAVHARGPLDRRRGQEARRRCPRSGTASRSSSTSSAPDAPPPPGRAALPRSGRPALRQARRLRADRARRAAGPPRDRLRLRRRRARGRARHAARPLGPLGGLVADRAARRRLPRQREHGGQRGALPVRAGSAPVGPPADPGAADRLGLAGVAARGARPRPAPPRPRRGAPPRRARGWCGSRSAPWSGSRRGSRSPRRR